MLKHANVPIVIICKDRINYLDLELRSICATVPAGTVIYLSNDGTKNPNTIKYLTTNDSVVCEDWSFPKGHKEWDDLIGELPERKVVTGIGGKVEVILHRESLGTKNLGIGVGRAFEDGASHVIKMEDDLVFTQHWYYTLIRAVANTNCDLASGFRYLWGKGHRTRSINDSVDEMFAGYTGGQLMIASRRFYKDCPHVFNNERTSIWDNDDFWIDSCRQANLKFAVVKKSVCQHIGFQTESGQKIFTKNGHLLKVDWNVKASDFRISDEVSGGHNVVCKKR
jgi:hypothetical protein